MGQRFEETKHYIDQHFEESKRHMGVLSEGLQHKIDLLAEGAARTGHKEFAQFLSVARGSLSELETQLLIAMELGYVSREHEVFHLTDRVSRLITGLHKSISR